MAHWQLARLRKKRRNGLVACVVFGLVFVIFVVGTIWSLSSSDYPWAEGELAADIATIAVSAALAVFAGFRARVFGRRADALSASHPLRRVSWLPPASDGDTGGAELETQIQRLRTTRWHAAAVLLAWVGVLLLGLSGFVLLDVIGQRLLDAGKRVPGTVEEVHNARRGSSTIMVTYVADGTTRRVKIYRDSELKYAPGQPVTVVYDRTDPERVRTVAERNDSQFVVWANFTAILAGLFGIPFSAMAVRGWWARHQAVRGTGWRPGTAEIVQERKNAERYLVEFHDGSTLRLSAVSYTLRRAPRGEDLSAVPVWVGGADRHMVIVLPRGRWSKGMHAVPVKADAPRLGRVRRSKNS